MHGTATSHVTSHAASSFMPTSPTLGGPYVPLHNYPASASQLSTAAHQYVHTQEGRTFELLGAPPPGSQPMDDSSSSLAAAGLRPPLALESSSSSLVTTQPSQSITELDRKLVKTEGSMTQRPTGAPQESADFDVWRPY